MLKEMITIAAFIFALSAVVAGFAVVQRSALSQVNKVEFAIEAANEIN